MSVPAIVPHCPVCAGPLPAGPWLCSRCETPHHRECADYFGGCAIFGCRDGHPPERLEQRTWPEVVNRLRFFVMVRRLQTFNLVMVALSFPGLALASAIQAPFPPLALAIGLGSFLMLFFGGSLAALGYMAGAALFSRLQGSVEAATSQRTDLSLSRVREALPGRDARHLPSLLLHLSGLAGLSIAAVSVVAATLGLGTGGLYGLWERLAFGGLLGGGLLKLIGHLFDHDRQVVDLFVSRFEASFAPLPQKPAKPAGD